jgi:hypothetical protein
MLTKKIVFILLALIAVTIGVLSGVVIVVSTKPH